MSWQIQAAWAAPKVRHGKQTLAHEKDVTESQFCSWTSLPLLLLFQLIRNERWQKLHLVTRGPVSAEINKLNNADEVNEVWFTATGSIYKKVMPLFLLVKSDNCIDNQLKFSFQRKKWMKPTGKSLPPKQTGEAVFVSAKVLLFTQTRRSRSWVIPQAGCLHQRWPFCRGPACHVQSHRDN